MILVSGKTFLGVSEVYESRNSVSDILYSVTAQLCRYFWLISFWFKEAFLKHGVVPLWMQWIISAWAWTRRLTVLTLRPIKGAKVKWFLCLCLSGSVCVSHIGVHWDCPTRSNRTELLGNVLGATTWFQTAVGSIAAFGPLFYFCSGWAGEKVPGWWGWMDALLTSPHLPLKLGNRVARIMQNI